MNKLFDMLDHLKEVITSENHGLIFILRSHTITVYNFDCTEIDVISTSYEKPEASLKDFADAVKEYLTDLENDNG